MSRVHGLVLAAVLLVAGVALAEGAPRHWKVARKSQRDEVARLALKIGEISEAKKKLADVESATMKEMDDVVAEIRSDCGIPAEIPTTGIRWADATYSELVEIAPAPSR